MRPWICLFLLTLVHSTGVVLRAQNPGEEKEIADTFIRQLVDLTKIYLDEMDPNQPGVIAKNPYHTHDVDPAYPMAYLYKTSHPLNPYFGDVKIRDTAIAIADYIASTQMRPEWPLYILCQVYDLLKGELHEAKRDAWKAYARDYVETRGIQPYFYTAPNHEAWNALGIYRAGQVFEEKEWRDRGARLMHQLLKMQSDLGYFDEGPHHGPSMKYNGIQLAGMLLFYDYSKDPVAFEASKKLADFMIRYSYPDGSLIATFDGRQDYSFGFPGTLAYGLDRWPLGKELNRRIYRNYKRWDLVAAKSPFFCYSDINALFGSFWTLVQYLSLRPGAMAAPLPQGRNGYRVVEHGRSFDGGVIRQHDWVVALSAINSDVPRYSRSVYQLERQSRLGIWHEKTGLIIGGGSNMVGAEVPLANFLLLTGHKGVDADFGLFASGSVQDRQATYFPRRLHASLELNQQLLVASFGQGDFCFVVKPLNDRRLDIEYQYDILAAKKAFVQLPLILYHDSEIQVDGRAYDRNIGTKVDQEIVIHNPTTSSAVKVLLEPATEAMLRPAVYPLRWYVGEHGQQRYRPYYQIALLSIKLDPPVGKGNGKVRIELVGQ
jgi:hypothetical protein